MFRKIGKRIAILAVCMVFAVSVSQQAEASGQVYCAGVSTTTSYVVKVDAPMVQVHSTASLDALTVAEVARGSLFPVLEEKDGWVKIQTEQGEGYFSLAGNGTMVEKTLEKVDTAAMTRNEVIEYALQFVGGRYVYGGNDPRTGVDCSGFTRYVMRHGAGIELDRSSRSQAKQGREIALSDIQPGDLLFYGSSSGHINHVAIYMGNDKIVHASTARTGIKISQWDYRKPVKAVSVID